MQLNNLKQAPFNTTLMGVLKGVLEYYGYDYTDSFIFGASGHAFLMNIHKELCPSSPYCWNEDGYFDLMRLMGIEINDLGFYDRKASIDAKDKLFSILKVNLDKGIPCSLLNMENQIVYGYEGDKLLTSQPWECSPNFPPKTLTFNDWEELNGEVHLNFYTYKKVKPVSKKKMIKRSILYAIDLYENPTKYSFDGYGIGPNAYTNYINAVEKHGNTHGNWWNATVWGENRLKAGEYLKECSEILGDENSVELATISAFYTEIGNILVKASEKEMPASEKKELLRHASMLEGDVITRLKDMKL
jgi:hypothetical protein